ncbi:DNA exonuclease, partial [Blautia wexlerae]
PCTLPQEFSNGNTDFYLTGKDEEINLIIKTTDGKLKQYYADYKDYYYLPEEDTVIPKSLGSGIDRKHRKAATRNTCYTWFTCSDAFLSSPVQQKQYLTYTLSCLIGTLECV